MADVWLPGAHRDPGANAGYNSGHSQMLRAVAHYTVGADSRGVAKRGYFHFLIHRDASRENGCTQYAEIDAVTWHAADAGNRYGPGIEYERMTTGGQNDEGLSNAQPLTENQIAWGSRIVAFCAEWGIPATLWDGARYGPPIMPGGNYRGWVNHHDLDPSRTDGLTNAEWSAVTGGATGGFTVGQMEDIAQWENDTRAIILDVLVGKQPFGTTGVLGQWENDTRAYVDRAIKESEKRIIAAINAG